jgi:hypothetical protein
MKPAANAAVPPLALELFEKQSREPLVCPAATTPLTNEKMAVVDANLFR